MKGYVARKGNRWYAVTYEGTDPVNRQGGSPLARGGFVPGGCGTARRPPRQ